MTNWWADRQTLLKDASRIKNRPTWWLNQFIRLISVWIYTCWCFRTYQEQKVAEKKIADPWKGSPRIRTRCLILPKSVPLVNHFSWAGKGKNYQTILLLGFFVKWIIHLRRSRFEISLESKVINHLLMGNNWANVIIFFVINNYQEQLIQV